ncbi:MAG: NAD-dependent epimerase/dehydratase family protein, partial [Lachnospiraceae bacterium]|nr:NAD-dependent epimerase/dehydratase family protein [Lachnospiraceae bacterium]
MKALLIGGTGVISKAISRRLLLDGHELWMINRGNRMEDLPEGVHLIQADVNEEADVAKMLGDQTFDVVADFIAFVPEQLERDHRLFAGRTGQFI